MGINARTAAALAHLATFLDDTDVVTFGGTPYPHLHAPSVQVHCTDPDGAAALAARISPDLWPRIHVDGVNPKRVHVWWIGALDWADVHISCITTRAKADAILAAVPTPFRTVTTEH